MSKLIDMKQERATLTASIREHMSKFADAEMDGQGKEALAKMESDFDRINNLIVTEEKQLSRERLIGEQKAEPVRDAKDELLTAFSNHLKLGDSRTFEIYNALQQDNPTQAGYLVAPEKFVMELIKDLEDANFMRQKAKVLPPLRGAQSLGYPTRTAAMSSFAWGTEIQAPSADSTLAFGKREF